jgi:uncharacterized protein
MAAEPLSPFVRHLLPSALLALLAVFACYASTAQAVALAGLYRATVPGPEGDAASRSAAYRQAMRLVVVRVTGRRDAAGAPALATLIDQAGRHGQVEIGFDGAAIEDAIAAAGLPYWGADRPTTLVWLAVDRGNGQRGVVTAATQSDERHAVEQAAQQRGVPIAWPSLAASDDPRRRFEQIMSGSTAGLAAEAARLGHEGLLIGRSAIRPGASAPTVTWSFHGAGVSGQSAGGLGEGPNLAADRLAGVYASVTAAQRNELRVSVSGVDTLAAYAATVKSLGSVDVVRSLEVAEVAGDRVLYRIAVRGDASSYRRALAARRELVPVVDGEGELNFQYRP